MSFVVNDKLFQSLDNSLVENGKKLLQSLDRIAYWGGRRVLISSIYFWIVIGKTGLVGYWMVPFVVNGKAFLQSPDKIAN